MPIGSNWDDRPRARGNAAVITGKTPDLFEKMCRASLTYIDARNNMAVIEAWNEWGEGSFIEPDKEFGFGLKDDGQWHTYQIVKKPEGKWTGTLDKLRFDIGTAGDEIEVDWIRIYKAAAQ